MFLSSLCALLQLPRSATGSDKSKIDGQLRNFAPQATSRQSDYSMSQINAGLSKKWHCQRLHRLKVNKMNEHEMVYLVVLRQILVSQDVAAIIADYDSNARVIVAADMTDALRQANGCVVMAFVDASLWANHHAQGVLAETMVVLVGDGPVAHDDAHRCRLDLPFTTDHILTLLDRRQFAQTQ